MTHHPARVRGRRTAARWTAGLAAAALAPLAVATGAPASATTPEGVASAPLLRAVEFSTTVRTESQLRRAVKRANQREGVDRIVLADDIRFADPRGAGRGGPLAGDLDVTDDLVVLGDGHTINARGVDRVFDVTAGTTVRLQALTLRNGAPAETESGGAVRSEGTVSLVGVEVRGSTVTGEGASGGAVMNDGGTLRVVDSVLGGNSAVRAGGAIEADGGSTTVRGTTLQANRTGDLPGNGGGLHLTGAGDVVVRDSLVVRNVAGAEGGGLWNSADGTMVVTNTVLRRNRALGDEATNGGGALFNDGGTLRVVDSVATANRATGASGSGGGLLDDQGTVALTGVRLVGNTAVRAGGAIETNIGTVRIVDTSALRNSAGDAPGNGGALHLTGAAAVTWRAGDVTGNDSAAEGGGLWNSDTGTLITIGVTVAGNTAPVSPDNHNDGGLFLADGIPVLPAS
ncbi:MAG: hypothetical protein CMH83_17705 [Nocardioides sp.]|nr:hypothetical protein [Nocardioides sp.]